MKNKIIEILSVYITTAILTLLTIYLIKPEEIGEFAVINSIYFFFAGILMYGIPQLMIKINFGERYYRHAKTKNFKISLYLLLIFITLMLYLEYNAIYIFLYSINIILISQNQIKISYLHNCKYYKKVKNIELVSHVISFVISLIILYVTHDIIAMLVYLTLINIIRTVLLINENIDIKNKNISDVKLRILDVIAFKFYILSLINYISHHGLILVMSLNLNYAQLGYIERANSIKNIPARLIGTILDGYYFPLFTGKNKIDINKKDFFILIVKSCLISILFCIILKIFLKLLIMQDLFSISEYKQYINLLDILLYTMPFLTLGRMVDILCKVKNKLNLNIKRKVFLSLFLIILIFIVSTTGDLIFVAYTLLFHQVIGMVLNLFIIQRVIK